ncbi:MAG: LPXTG-motif cell wall anchor domain protein [Verrucomicrobiales bacterium]|nr:LPXTG-motif cell wall anchor domain protein [Verrucomicrobiales bacterium]
MKRALAFLLFTAVFPVASLFAADPASTNNVSLPNGFKYEVLVEGDIPEPVDLDFAPDGRLWFTSRRGFIWAYDFKSKSKKEIAHIQVPFEQIKGKENNERGLHGLEFDPNFSKNGYVYLHYATLTGDLFTNRVSRFTFKNDQLVAGSEKIYLQIPSTRGYHQGGVIEYNKKDGKLYISTGDNNVSNETKKFFDDPNNPPQNLGDLRGKVLRLNLDGTIPKDNPFVNTPGARPEIFTYGHRNPYSMNIDPKTGNVYVGEVGFDGNEAIEEINFIKPGGNYGWPRCSGNNQGTFGGDCPIKDAISPWIMYVHQQGGASITSGPFYRDNGVKNSFPKEWRDGMFYADYSRKWIRFAKVNPADNSVITNVPFGRGFGGPLSMKQGPDGALYFNEYGGWFTGSPKDRLSRIVYTGEGVVK